MSYWCYMQIDTGGPYEATVAEIGNMTWNVSPMFVKALGCHLTDLEGKTGAELEQLLHSATTHIEAPENEQIYRNLNPVNGWGNHDSAKRYMAAIHNACKEHPKAKLHIST